MLCMIAYNHAKDAWLRGDSGEMSDTRFDVKLFVKAKSVKFFFGLGRGRKHKTWCFSQAKHRTDLKIISFAMNFDDGDAYTPFCYAKSSKKGSLSKNIDVKLFCLDQKCEVVFRPRSMSKTQNLMFLAGEASYRPENHILRNEIRRRRCLYPHLLCQIFQKRQFVKKKLMSKFCWCGILREIWLRVIIVRGPRGS